MTYREKMMEFNEAMVDEAYCGGVHGCPHHYLGAEKPENCTVGEPKDAKCRQCWNREVPTDGRNKAD